MDLSNCNSNRDPRAGRDAVRRGAVAVEAALCMPILVMLMLGIWEVGRMAQYSRTLVDAAREGARVAAGGISNGTSVTAAMVQQTVRNYMTDAGFPSAAVSGAAISVNNLSSHTWTDPCNASQLDPFTVTVTIPSGTAFNSLSLSGLSITGINQLSASVYWLSNNNTQVTVSTTLPY
jgi:Flp pilus assembly protein TadG